MRSFIKKGLILETACLLAAVSPAIAMADTYNMLLIGVDRKDVEETWNGNSDTMILVTVNDERETIYMTSFMRDLYADVPGVGVGKLNSAFAVGGADLCVETLINNYDVEIDNYATVDFYDMMEIVDSIGGVDMELTESEVEYANGYAYDMSLYMDNPGEVTDITGSGLVHLDGIHAVAFMRNRFSGGENDFGRTGRQRQVLKTMLRKLKDSGVGTLVSFAKTIYLKLDTDLTEFGMLGLASNLPDWIHYSIEEQRIPYDDSYYSENEILTPYDMEATRERIRETIY